MREKGGYVCENTFIVHPPPSPGVHLTLLLLKLKYAHNNQILIKCRFYRTNLVKNLSSLHSQYCCESGSHEHSTYRSYRSVILVSTCCQLGSRPWSNG